MSCIESKNVEGNLSVGRDISVGGNARISGNATIEHNLTVKGWLRADNVSTCNKGVFMTIDDLREVYPNPKDGWFAGVGSEAPFGLYIANGGEWIDTGTTFSFEKGEPGRDGVDGRDGHDGSFLFPTVRVDSAGFLVVDIPDSIEESGLSIDDDGYLCVRYPDIVEQNTQL